MLKPLLAVAAMAAAPLLYAQVEVVESTPLGGSSPASTATGLTTSAPEPAALATPAPANTAAEMFYQMQVLQQEVLQLRGLVEEQAHELKRLKQQRLDDYLDLDRRISGLSASPGTGKPKVAPGSSTTSSTKASPAAADEAQSYRAAYDLLKKRQIGEAVTAFSGHLEAFPSGQHAANAHYWLGEIYLLKNDLEAARQSFTTLIDGFSVHRKVPDAKFKLGKVYDLLGDKVKAKVLLEEVAASSADASRLAKNYLQANF